MTTRVTFVLPDFEAGGAQRVVVAVANGLDRRRYAPSIVTLNEHGPWRSLVADDVSVTNLRRLRLRQSLGVLRSALRRSSPDVIVSTIGYLNLGVLISRPSSTPVIVRESNAPLRGAGGAMARIAQRLAYAVLYRRANAVISPSGLIADELARDCHVPRHLIHVVRNPVDERSLRQLASPPRRRPGEGARFVAVGRLSRQKGYDQLLQTLGTGTHDDHIVIFGEGEERAALEAQSRSLGLDSRVAFAGFDPNPAPWIAGADALLLPSRWEGLPNVALEALACGTPVIATPESGGIGEIAERAAAGGVTVASMGRQFLAAMVAVPRNAESRLRPSLLPQDFQTDAVIAEYQRNIDRVLQGERRIS